MGLAKIAFRVCLHLSDEIPIETVIVKRHVRRHQVIYLWEVPSLREQPRNFGQDVNLYLLVSSRQHPFVDVTL